jgi:hypothetical protein
MIILQLLPKIFAIPWSRTASVLSYSKRHTWKQNTETIPTEIKCRCWRAQTLIDPLICGIRYSHHLLLISNVFLIFFSLLFLPILYLSCPIFTFLQLFTSNLFSFLFFLVDWFNSFSVLRIFCWICFSFFYISDSRRSSTYFIIRSTEISMDSVVICRIFSDDDQCSSRRHGVTFVSCFD